MIKFIIFTTVHCNFVVMRMEVEPVYNIANLLTHWKVISNRRLLPPHSFGYLPGGVSDDRVFNSFAEAEAAAKIRSDDLKNKFIKQYTHKAEYAKERLEVMTNHTPKIRRINLVK